MIKLEMVYISFFVLLISIQLRVNGQCPDGEYRTVTRCGGSTKPEKRIYADFSKINRPCTCTVTAMFVGQITVTSWRVESECNIRVTVNNKVTFNCRDGGSDTFDISNNNRVLFWADYQQGYTEGQFKQCIGIENKGDGDGKLSIKCNAQHRPVSSIKTTTTRHESPIIQMSSKAPLKEYTIAVNSRRDAYFNLQYVLRNGKCPNGEEYRTATSCDGTTKSEKHLYVDFSKINRPCACTVTALFSGRIAVTSWGVEHSKCNNKVTVNNVTFNCKDNKYSRFDVRINDRVLFVADFWQGYTSGEFKQCLGVGNEGDSEGKLSIKCETQPRPNSTIKSTTIRSSASRSIQMSSTAPLKESTVVVNKKQKAYSTPKYAINTGNVDFKSSTKKSTSVDFKNEKKNAYSSTALILNTNTANLKPSSAKLVATNLQKKDAYFTTTYVFNARTTDLTISLEESRTTDPENLSVLASIATGGIVLAIALVICIIIIMNRMMKDRNNGLVMKSAKGNTNRASGNSISLPNNPLNNISLHVEEVDNSSAQNQQFGLLQTASKLNYKVISDYDVPPNNKTVDQGVYSLAKNEAPNKNDELCPDVISEDVYAQVFKQNNGNPLAPIQAQTHDDDGLVDV